jgi:hypothetical protein
MASKKISELDAKTPSATDVLPVANPSTGVAGKSTCSQIIASAAGFTNKTPDVADWIPIADTASPAVAWKTRPYSVTYVGIKAWAIWQTNGSFAQAPYTVNVTSNKNNLQIGVYGIVFLNCTVASDLTGLVSDASYSYQEVIPGGSVTSKVNGQIVYLVNTGSASVSIVSESASSSAVNRLLTHNGGNINLQPNHMAMCMYDSNISRWRVWDLT